MAAKLTPASASSIVQLFGPRVTDDEEEIAVGLPSPTPSFAGRKADGPASLVVPELAGRPKVWFVIGPGRSGKTTLIRYVMDVVAAGNGSALAAALDPQNRSLANFVEGVAQPPTNDAAAVARWLESLLRAMMENGTSALLDLGGGDTSLGRILADVPDLAATMEGAGVAPVAIYTLGPRVDDLASLATFEAQGFQSRATALVLNEALADPTMPREDAFARVIRHSAFKAAVARGAVVMWMPRLEPSVAADIEGKRLGFASARDGVLPTSRTVTPLGVFDRSRVRAWMNGMDVMLAPITAWLP